MEKFNELCPRTLRANCTYRRKLNELAHRSPQWRNDLWIMCKRDILFFVNSFLFLFEPRPEISSIGTLPWVTWPYQEKAILQIKAALGKRDLEIYKSRDMAGTWMCLAVMFHAWLFEPRKNFLLASRKEDLVDDPGNMKALLPKCDFMYEHLPLWMKPQLIRKDLHFFNGETRSLIAGESTNKNLARGDRLTAIFLDEFSSVENSYEILAATTDATDCRIFNSTPQGAGNAFYDIHTKGLAEVVDLPWWDHPRKRAGLYQGKAGNLEILDKGYVFPAGYKFLLDGKLRSPWYDETRKKLPSDLIADQELDRSFNAFGAQFFSQNDLDRIRLTTIMPPVGQGEIVDGKFVDVEEGHLKMWVGTDIYGMSRGTSRYVVSADISAGTGSSNSVIVVVDRATGAKVAEYANAYCTPQETADIALELCAYFKGQDDGAFLVWEANGPGLTFSKRILDSGYRNFYWRPASEKSAFEKRSNIPGFWTSGAAGGNSGSKKTLFFEYKDALSSGRFVERSITALHEHCEYKYMPDGSIEHVGSRAGLDPSGAKDNHGDRVVANAIACKFIDKDALAPTSEDVEKIMEGAYRERPKPGSIAYMMVKEAEYARLVADED